jgi:hypothetical protein
MAKAKKSSKSSRSSIPSTDVPSAKTTDSTQLRGELQQLAEIRQKFPALSPVLAGAFLAQHSDDDCRARRGHPGQGDLRGRTPLGSHDRREPG